MKRLKFLACFGFFFLFFSHCIPVVLIAAGAGAGAGVIGFKFYEGQVIAVYQALFIDAWDATERVARSIPIQIMSQEHDETSGRFEGTLPDGRPVAIGIYYRSSQETEVRIRVTTFGDEKASREIHEKIRNTLFGE